jgi:hypothetical protein
MSFTYNCYSSCCDRLRKIQVCLFCQYIVVHVLVGRGGRGADDGAGNGFQIGQLTLGKRPAKMGICRLVQGATILSKGLFLHINKLHLPR